MTMMAACLAVRGGGKALQTGATVVQLMPKGGIIQTNFIIIPTPRRKPPFMPHGFTPKPQFKVLPSRPSKPWCHPSSPPTLAPGVYQTLPYTCLVVVPNPHLDDGIVCPAGSGRLSMPTVKPELRFIPLK
jgi:hypothetical protein